MQLVSLLVSYFAKVPRRFRVWICVLAVFIAGATVLFAQSSFSGPSHHARRKQTRPFPILLPARGTNFGEPLPGLTADQLADFVEGQADFEEEDTVASGLGPIFNNVSCVICHSSPVTGGSSGLTVTRFGRVTNGHFDPLADKGGSLLQAMAIDPLVQEIIPPEANVIAHRQTTPLFGLGLVEAIPDSTIMALAQMRKPDNITGRISVVQDVATGKIRVGHFGWKAQQATLLSFSGDAYLNEVGITSRLFPVENAPNGNTNLLAEFDTTPGIEDGEDPVSGKADIDFFTDFMRFLAPPPTLPLTRSAMAGAAVFNQINCAVCHQPLLLTGTNSIKALNRKPVALFSDLLLHDMGPLGDGIVQGNAGGRDFKTPPLWGLRASGPYLHDGRAATVDEAIRAHDGEAARARNRYLQLSPADRQRLLDFLNSI